MIRVHDGLNAVCEMEIDSLRSKARSVFRFVNPKVEDLGDSVKLTVNVNFYICNKSGETYRFERDLEPSYEIYKTFSGDKFVERIALNRYFLATSEQSSYFNKTTMTESGSTVTASAVIHKDDLDINNFELARELGDVFTTISMTTHRQIKSEDYNEKFLVPSASYRVFIDLDSMKARIQ
jgi:hypothetical protein